jgi:predicted phosphodiesterase
MVSETRKFRNRFFPQCEILVCGHFHRAGIWDEKNLLVINTGSFMPPGGAYWCEWNEGLFTVGVVKKSAAAFARGEILGVWKIL